MKLQKLTFSKAGTERCIHFFCCMISILISACAFAQKSYDWRTNIDLIVQQTDSLSLKSQQTFHLLKYFDDKTVRETWHYTQKDGNVIIFEVRYFMDSTEHADIFYLNKGKLICMEQYESEDFMTYDDEIKKGKVFFFVNNALKQYVTVGNDNLRSSHWDRQADALQYFNKRYLELQRNRW